MLQPAAFSETTSRINLAATSLAAVVTAVRQARLARARPRLGNANNTSIGTGAERGDDSSLRYLLIRPRSASDPRRSVSISAVER